MKSPAVFRSPVEPIYRTVSTWRAARDGNLTETRRILDAAGIRHVEVDDVSTNRGHVAIDLADREALVAAFEQHATHGCYVAGMPWTATVRLQMGTGTRLSRSVARRRLKISTGFIVCHLARFGPAGRVFGISYGTVISLWERQPTENASKITGSAGTRWGSELSDPDPLIPVLDVVERSLCGHRHIDDIDFPIDLVVLWVDGDDAAWAERRQRRFAEIEQVSATQTDPIPADSATATDHSVEDGGVSDEANLQRLYRSRDELRYALRSVRMFASFINHIYLVTDRQTPAWLESEAEGITVVDHRDIFEPGTPDIFNSSAIDTRLHHIDGISEHFLVSNDDIFFLNPTFPSDFFTSAGSMRLFLSKAKIPISDEVPGEPAVDSASRNTRRLLERTHGVTATQKFKHIMIPQRVSIRSEIAARYANEVDQTARSSFRSSSDISFSHLVQYEGLLSGRGIESALPYDYVGLDSLRLKQRLDGLIERPGSLKVICLNDADLEVPVDHTGQPIMTLSEAEDQRDHIVSDFLRRCFPVPGDFESADFLTRERVFESKRHDTFDPPD